MGEKREDKVRLKGQLRLYMRLPMIMAFLLLVVDCGVFLVDYRAGIAMSAFALAYIAMISYMYTYSRGKIIKDLVEFAAQYGTVQNTLLKELNIPYAILLEDGKSVWMNKQFEKILDQKAKEEIYISKYIPEINSSIFPREDDDIVELDLIYREREYRAELRKVSVEGFSETEQLLALPGERDCLIAVCLQDVTEMNQYIRDNDEQRLVAGLVYIDNYDELLNSVEDVRQSLLIALVDRKITQYIASVNGIVRKVENDKYFIAIQKRYLKELENDKFSLLEDVKSVNIGNSIPATISIGLGVNDSNYTQSYSFARGAIDLALARGGDQVVIKNPNGITCYGGKREQISRNTRVKARVKAEALREFMTMKDRIFVMGHKLTDVDAFGAAIGVYRAAKALDKQVHIVINEVSASLRPLYASYDGNPDYPENLFLNSKEALELADENSLVIVVDTNRAMMVECEELLRLSKTVVVLDHHRQSADNIDLAVLSYIEPYASSACEMIAEVLQYITDDIRIPKLEASSLYAGIMIDTNNFVYKTGVRTFEAAAFLRRHGADISLVKKMFRDDMESYQVKAAIISSAEVFCEKFAIAVNMATEIESPTIIGAQAANELLEISNIKASFVLTTYNGRIYVSARSIDEVNVQIIMEKLGGGGHMNAAGVQFDHTDMEKAVADLKQVIETMQGKGDI